MRFVVHEHRARRHHFDLRLELGGVLKSWAVPKGPSLDPSEKRLAVGVEDHPLGYGDFEGVIPPGEYGAGPVVIWDRGEFVPLSEDPEGDLRRGKLSFVFRRRKLRGRFTLLRLRRKEPNQWLLIKQADEFARPGWRIESELPGPTGEASSAAGALPLHLSRLRRL
jgi:bifunctional non-homologous end joining protein LigD